MRIDMANFTIRMSRPHIAACSVEYERAKFEDYLKITPGKIEEIMNSEHYSKIVFEQMDYGTPENGFTGIT